MRRSTPIPLLFLFTACAPYQPPADVRQTEQRSLQGIATKKLSGSDQARFFALLNSEICPCCEPHSLADCLRANHCRDARPAAQFIARQLPQEKSDTQLRDLLMKRFGATKPIEFALSDAPSLGNPRAPVLLVVFSDFECPHCREFAPVLKQLVESQPDRVRLAFKHFPLSRHAQAQAAAQAATAAALQDKFWPMHDALFEDPEHLAPADIEGDALNCGLDIERFRNDMASEAVATQVKADKSEGEKVGVSGTPTLFINGRKFTGDRSLEGLREWIEDESP